MLPLLDQWNGLGTPRICVVGDLILDRYIWTTADRVSPEAPVLVVQAGREEDRLGGAASVAAMLRGLQCEVSLVGITGADIEGQRVRDLIEQAGIEGSAVHADPNRPTTLKSRILARAAHRQAHQLLRIDREVRTPANDDQIKFMLTAITANLPRTDAILVSDYGKGVCSSVLISAILQLAEQHDLPVVVDPAKNLSIDRYRNATVLTPNRSEASAAVGTDIRCFADATRVGAEICSKWAIQAVIMKLDSDGLVICQHGIEPHFVPTTARAVCDVTGAGDMVLAVTGLCLASGWSLPDAATVANLAAGLEVERIGVTAISREEVAAALQLRHFKASDQKVITIDGAAKLANSYRDSGRRIVFTNGCFDLLHAGHVYCLEQAAALGDVLFVAANSDASSRRLKGLSRPIIEESQRLTLLAALACVDHVILMEEDTPHVILQAIRPHVLAKGAPYTPDSVIGSEIVTAYGGEVAITGSVSGLSTTVLQDRILKNGKTTENHSNTIAE